MASAVASKAGAPVAAGLLNNLRHLATPSSSLLGPASVAATRRLYSTGGTPFHRASFSVNPAAPRMWWVWKQEDAVEVKVAMPGLPAERVKDWANKKGLLVKGEGVKGPYSFHVKLSTDALDLEKAKAEMKHGLLKVTVPRVKGTEIKIEGTEIKIE